MEKYTKEELEEALKVIISTINKCEKMQPKFSEGTSQYTLLKNRIKAMYISKAVILGEDLTDKYEKEELTEALRPVASIISKCEKGQQKFAEGSSHHTKFKKIIRAMYISEELIKTAIEHIE